MKRKLYSQASKANAKRFYEAKIQDQLTEIKNILDVFHETCCDNASHVLPAVRIDENNNIQDSDLILEDILVYNPPNHETEATEYSEHSSSDELKDEIICDTEYLINRPIHMI